MTTADAQAFLDAHAGYQAYRAADAAGSMMSLDVIWREHGRPWLSPARYRRQYVRRGGSWQAGPDNWLVEPAVALQYLENLDTHLAISLNMMIGRMFMDDPARQMTQGYDVPLVAAFAAFFARTEGESEADTQERIVAEVADRSEGMDPYQQETAVAVARRAFGSTRPD